MVVRKNLRKKFALISVFEKKNLKYLFIKRKNEGFFPITDQRMTRFMISLEQGVRQVWDAFNDMKAGEIYVKKTKSMKVVDIARTINPDNKFEIIGCRPGEKIHELLCVKDEAINTVEFKDYYTIAPTIMVNNSGKFINNYSNFFNENILNSAIFFAFSGLEIKKGCSDNSSNTLSIFNRKSSHSIFFHSSSNDIAKLSALS